VYFVQWELGVLTGPSPTVTRKVVGGVFVRFRAPLLERTQPVIHRVPNDGTPWPAEPCLPYISQQRRIGATPSHQKFQRAVRPFLSSNEVIMSGSPARLWTAV
jgi:hypothetical protein